MLSRIYRFLLIFILVFIWLGILGATSSESKGIQTIIAIAIFPFLMCLDTIFIFGSSFFKPIPFMLQIFTRSSRSPMLVGIFLLNYFFYYPPFTTVNFPYKNLVFFVFSISLILLYLQPPFLFVLGESSTPTGRILSKLSSGLFPLRTVAMLDRKRTKAGSSTFSWLTDDLRAHSERDWRDIADQLLGISKLVVLDARTDSSVVIYEVANILSQPEVLSKTFFIVEADGNAAALKANGYENQRSDIHVITEDEVEKLVSRDYLSQALHGWEL